MKFNSQMDLEEVLFRNSDCIHLQILTLESLEYFKTEKEMTPEQLALLATGHVVNAKIWRIIPRAWKFSHW